jgi:hypothetical protein
MFLPGATSVGAASGLPQLRMYKRGRLFAMLFLNGGMAMARRIDDDDDDDYVPQLVAPYRASWDNAKTAAEVRAVLGAFDDVPPIDDAVRLTLQRWLYRQDNRAVQTFISASLRRPHDSPSATPRPDCRARPGSRRVSPVDRERVWDERQRCQ